MAHNGNVSATERKTWERGIAILEDKVIKRELRVNELLRRQNGHIVQPFWAKERLINEAATIQFVAKHTDIPVPQCKLYTKDGVLHLETTRIKSGVTLWGISEDYRPAAISAVEKQLTESILPQLRSLTRDTIGSVDPSLPVFPPSRVYRRDRRPWERIRSDTNEFVLCHNDLGPGNIFICLETFRIVGIIDWEFAGFFPPYFELPLWGAFDFEERKRIYDEANSQELGFFGLCREDLVDCTPPLP